MKVSHKPILFAALGSFFLAFALTGSAWAQNNNTRPARPGSINYVEGQASIGGQTLGSSSAGSAELQAGQTLTTQTGGKVEILLTPGVFLRVGDNTAVKMISPDLANTEVELDKGEAMVEVSNISKNNNIRIDENGANIQLVNKGLYDFDSDNRSVRVFKGKAEVHVNNQNIKVGDTQQITRRHREQSKLEIGRGLRHQTICRRPVPLVGPAFRISRRSRCRHRPPVRKRRRRMERFRLVLGSLV